MEKTNAARRLSFASDYMEGCHPRILQRLAETNMEQSPGYGLDGHSEAARRLIREACQAPDAEIFFLAGGTQANAVTLGALLRPWQCVLAAGSGHISVHEAGAIEAGGHKVAALPHRDGRLAAQDVRRAFRDWQEDANRDHMPMPGLVYLSQPTECGTLYSLAELEALGEACREAGMLLYVDGARLAYALGCPANDASLADIASIADAFYIGGTKCGALFGEAVVFPRPGTAPRFFTQVKRAGALLAKGRIAGIQFQALFEDGLYARLGRQAVAAANRIRDALCARGFRLAYPSPTNQIFVELSAEERAGLERIADIAFWEKSGEGRAVMRIATSWATREEDVDALLAQL